MKPAFHFDFRIAILQIAPDSSQDYPSQHFALSLSLPTLLLALRSSKSQIQRLPSSFVHNKWSQSSKPSQPTIDTVENTMSSNNTYVTRIQTRQAGRWLAT